MLNNLISNPHHYTTPKARETNTKASVNVCTNSNTFRDMFMSVSTAGREAFAVLEKIGGVPSRR